MGPLKKRGTPNGYLLDKNLSTKRTFNMPHYQDGDYEPEQRSEQQQDRDDFKRDTTVPSGPARENNGGGTVIEDGVIQSTWDTIVDNFDDMNLRENLLRGIFAYGFEKPSAIQQRAIIPAIKGYDLIAQAQSGTGKTATFSIAILQQIDFDPNKSKCQALVLAPTRELAQQIQKVVLDQADEMLSRGFKDQIYDVFRKLPSNIQVILLSATMPEDVLEVTKRFMRDPINILVKKEELTLE